MEAPTGSAPARPVLATAPRRVRRAAPWLLLAVGGAALLVAGVLTGSTGWADLGTDGVDTASVRRILWEIRLPRSLGAWLAGALLGLAGALAQALFRNPLADPYLLGSASGAGLGVALALAAGAGALPVAVAALGLTGAAFLGALGAVGLAVMLARGALHTGRLLLAGVVMSVVLGALTALVTLVSPEVLRAMQGFMLGTTAFLGWSACAALALTLAAVMPAAALLARGLDALALGDATAATLGVPVAGLRALVVALMALATGAAVAQAGLVGFVGLAAPHIVRRAWVAAGLPSPSSRLHGVASAGTGGLLLLAADVLARALVAPQELPVGIVTAILGGGWLLWRLGRGAA